MTLGLAPTVRGATSKSTTLYFTDYLPFLASNESDYGLEVVSFAPLAPTPPMKTKDAEYPPPLFIENTSGGRLPSLNGNNISLWVVTSWVAYFLEDYGFNFSDYSDLLPPGVSIEDLKLYFPNPLRIVEQYKYTGTEPLTITGDVPFTAYFDGFRHGPFVHDNLTVSLYLYNENATIPIPRKIQSTSVGISTHLTTVPKTTIALKNVSFTVKPDESLLASIEIQPGNRSNLILKRLDLEKLAARAQKIGDRLANSSHARFQTIGEFFQELIPLVKEFNFTTDDLLSIINTLKAPHFLYDSIQHPTSLTIPTALPGPAEIITYYLHADQNMSSTPPAKNSSTSLVLGTSTWKATTLPRNKIIHNATATLYLRHLLVPTRFSVMATLYDNNVSIANVSVRLPSNRRGQSPALILFPNLNYEPPLRTPTPPWGLHAKDALRENLAPDHPPLRLLSRPFIGHGHLHRHQKHQYQLYG